jgi:hypothetical protein
VVGDFGWPNLRKTRFFGFSTGKGEERQPKFGWETVSSTFLPAKENAGHTITYRPKYSPVLGPTELSVHDLKTYLRRHRKYINDDNLLEWVSTSSIAGYVDDFL